MEHCGYLVRDRIPISIREWKKKINEPNVSFVSDVDKNLLWNDILAHFMLQADDYDDINDDELKELVQKWTMKKIATQFQTWEKSLYTKYVKKNLTPNFNTSGPLAKLRPYWNDFVQYKTSEEGEKELRECPTEGIPPWHGIRWLRDCHCQVGKNESRHSCQGYHTRITQLAQTREELVFHSWGKTRPRDQEV